MTAAQQLGQKFEQRGAHNKALYIARNMLYKLHLDMKSVSEATGLSKEELMKLQEEENEKKWHYFSPFRSLQHLKA